MSRNAMAIGLVAAACLAVGVGGSAADYEIRFDRRFTVGDEMGLVATAKAAHAEKVIAEGKVVEDNKAAMQVRLEAGARVLAVDKAGHPARVAYAVRRFEGSIGGQAVEPIPKGAVIIAEAGQPFRLEHGELAEPMGELLDLILKVRTEGDPGDDEPFGTRERKKVGDQWPVSKAAVVKGLAANGMTATEDAVSGAVKLIGVQEVGGVPCLKTEGRVDVRGFDPGLPPGGKVVSSSMAVRTTGDFPVDLSLPRLNETVSFQVAIRGTVTPPEGPAVNLEMSGSQEVTRSFSIAVPNDKPLPLGAGHGLPWFLNGSGLLERQAEGIDLKGKVLASKPAGFFEDDFVIDLAFTLRADDGIADVGFDDGHGKGHVYVGIHPPRFAPSGVNLWLPKAGNVGLAPNTGAGEYLVRVDRRGDAVTFAVDAQYDGNFKPDVERTIPDIRAIAPWLRAGSARLYFGKGGLFRSIRLGKAPPVAFHPADPIYAKLQRAKADHAKAAPGRLADAMLANAYRIAIRDYTATGKHDLAGALEAEMDQRGFATPTPAPRPGTEDTARPEAVTKEASSRLGGRSRFPSWLVAQGPILAGKTGLRTQGRHYIRTKDGGFLGRDFAFEVVFSLGTRAEGDGTAFLGFGEAGNRGPNGEPSGSVCLHVLPWDLDGGNVELSTSGPLRGTSIGKIPKPGTHRVTIEKKGNQAAFAIDVGNDGPSPNDISQACLDIEAFAPFLNEANTHLFFGGGGTYEQVRLSVANLTPTPTTLPPDKLYRLAPGEPVPPYLDLTRAPLADKDGVSVKRGRLVATKDASFFEKDFVIDLVFALAADDGIMCIWFGDEGANKHLLLRLHPPRFAPQGVDLSKDSAQYHGVCLNTGACDHMVRIERKGKTITYSLDAPYDGTFKPEAFRRVDDITTYVPYLNAKTAILRLRHGGTLRGIRLRDSGGTIPELPAARQEPKQERKQ